MKTKKKYLSEREIEVCKLFVKLRGCANWKESAAETFCISKYTLNTHLANINRILDVHTQNELMYLLLTTNKWILTKWSMYKIDALLREDN